MKKLSVSHSEAGYPEDMEEVGVAPEGTVRQARPAPVDNDSSCDRRRMQLAPEDPGGKRYSMPEPRALGDEELKIGDRFPG